MPYGFSGVVSASTICFYSFSGFETISAAAEESKNPKKHILLASITAILKVTAFYIAVSGSLILLVPLDLINISTPFQSALKYHNYPIAEKILSLGISLTLIASLFNCFYTISPYMFSIATDGLLFPQMAYVNSKTKSPIVSIAVSFF